MCLDNTLNSLIEKNDVENPKKNFAQALNVNSNKFLPLRFLNPVIKGIV